MGWFGIAVRKMEVMEVLQPGPGICGDPGAWSPWPETRGLSSFLFSTVSLRVDGGPDNDHAGRRAKVW